MLPEVPCHVTQRGVDRRETFSADEDRLTYLRLLRENLRDAQVRLLAWCLMTNHVHLLAVPARDESLSVLFRRVHDGSRSDLRRDIVECACCSLAANERFPNLCSRMSGRSEAGATVTG